MKVRAVWVLCSPHVCLGFLQVFSLSPETLFKGSVLKWFCLSPSVTCKYFQLLSQSILWKIPLQSNYLLGPGRQTQKTSFSEAENVIYFPSAMVSKVKIPLIRIDFSSLFFSFLYFRWLIFIHTFSRKGVKGLPPVSTMLPTSSSRINYVSSTSFFVLNAL